MALFQGLVDPILSPLLNLNSFLAVAIMSLAVTLIITLIYKFTTNQKLMKDLKTEMKEFQKEMKELRAHPEEAMKVQKKAMQTNMKYMSHSMKSTLFTLLPVIILFGWMNANFAFTAINPGMEFTTAIELYEGQHGSVALAPTEGIEIMGETKKDIADGELMWALKGKEGEYLLEYDVNGIKYYKDLLITSGKKYAQPVKQVNDQLVKSISINNKKLIVLDLLGWKIGWLGTYIILSIIFSSVIRKLLKVY